MTNVYDYRGARPENLPTAVAAALTAYDGLIPKYQAAEQTARALADKARDTEAEKADRAAAATAAGKGQTIPEPTAVPKLRDDRAKAERELAAFRDAVIAAADKVSEERNKAAAAGATAEQTRRAEAEATLTAQAEALAAAIDAEAAARARHDWLRGQSYGSSRRPQVAAWDVAPILLSRGVGPGVGRDSDYLEPAADVVRRIVGAAFGQEK